MKRRTGTGLWGQVVVGRVGRGPAHQGRAGLSFEPEGCHWGVFSRQAPQWDAFCTPAGLVCSPDAPVFTPVLRTYLALLSLICSVCK